MPQDRSSFVVRVRGLFTRWRLGELRVYAALLAVCSGAWAFLTLASEIREGETRSFDESILATLRRADNPALPIGPDWLGNAARDITALGSASVLVLVVLAAAGFLALRRRFAAMALVLAAIVTGEILSTILKTTFDRSRPEVVSHLDQVYTSSFPSGHSMLSALVYLTLGALLVRFSTGRFTKAYILTCAVLSTLLIGTTRVYLGVHYPTDVLAGWCAGLVWAIVWWLIARWLQRRSNEIIPQ